MGCRLRRNGGDPASILCATEAAFCAIAMAGAAAIISPVAMKRRLEILTGSETDAEAAVPATRCIIGRARRLRRVV